MPNESGLIPEQATRNSPRDQMLSQLLRERYSCRGFRTDPVARPITERTLVPPNALLPGVTPSLGKLSSRAARQQHGSERNSSNTFAMNAPDRTLLGHRGTTGCTSNAAASADCSCTNP